MKVHNNNSYNYENTNKINSRNHSNSNKYKTRIIEAEINSGLFLQILLHYNIFAFIIIFSFQIITTSYKVR